MYLTYLLAPRAWFKSDTFTDTIVYKNLVMDDIGSSVCLLCICLLWFVVLCLRLQFKNKSWIIKSTVICTLDLKTDACNKRNTEILIDHKNKFKQTVKLNNQLISWAEIRWLYSLQWRVFRFWLTGTFVYHTSRGLIGFIKNIGNVLMPSCLRNKLAKLLIWKQVSHTTAFRR